MDPLHITEFASERYFSKLRALNEAAEHAAENPASTAVSNPPQSFNLPIGHGRPTLHDRRGNSEDTVQQSEHKKRSIGHDIFTFNKQRRPSLGGFRSKVTIVNKSPSLYVEHHEDVFEEEPVPIKRSLNDLFLALPSELQVQIIAPLPVRTILDMRLVSKSFHSMVTFNESPIVRYHIKYSIPNYAIRRYPLPEPDSITLQYLCGIWHRLHVASKLATLIAEYATKDIFLRVSETQRAEFEPQHVRMRQRLLPLIFTMFHFFERYRDLHVQHLSTHGVPLSRQPYTLNPIERQVMDTYDDQTLLKVHQVFPFVLSSFSRRLRPPSYAGRIERSIKGYLKDRPADEVYTAILAIGGLRQAERFWQTKGYNVRRTFVDTWYASISHDPANEPATKTKKSILSTLGRKKSNSITEAPTADLTAGSICTDWYCVKPNCGTRHLPSQDLVFHTSLAYGPPMGPLPADTLKLLIADLQPLTSLWSLTAEATILERGIVESPTQIKRNTQVLLELIGEDGNLIEDVWSPAAGADFGVRGSSMDLVRGMRDI